MQFSFDRPLLASLKLCGPSCPRCPGSRIRSKLHDLCRDLTDVPRGGNNALARVAPSHGSRSGWGKHGLGSCAQLLNLHLKMPKRSRHCSAPSGVIVWTIYGTSECSKSSLAERLSSRLTPCPACLSSLLAERVLYNCAVGRKHAAHGHPCHHFHALGDMPDQSKITSVMHATAVQAAPTGQ